MKNIIWTYTRKIDKEYNRLLFKSCIVSTDNTGKQNFSINPADIQDAKDYLLKVLCWMSDVEVENLSIKEYEEISKTLDEFIKKERWGSVAEWSAETVS